MSQQLTCPACRKTYEVDHEVVGRMMHCESCGTQWFVAERAGTAPSAGAPTGKASRPAPAAKKADEGPLLPPIKRTQHAEDLIDMTAMVDIVFFLLIFFLVTSLKAIESVMEMPTPESSTGSMAKPTDYSDDPETVMINIQDDDSILIDEDPVYGDDEMRSKLRTIRKETPSITKAMIVGSADASHGAAVRVFDACNAVGFQSPIFTVEETE